MDPNLGHIRNPHCMSSQFRTKPESCEMLREEILIEMNMKATN